MTSEQLKEVSVLAKKNESISFLLKEWTILSQSPYQDTYLTLFNQVADWNKQLKIIEEGTHVTGRINLFSDKDSKEFDRTFKYFSDITTLLDALDVIRGKMSPSQQKEVDEKISKNKSIAV